MFSIYISRAKSKSHFPTKPASPDMVDADNTVELLERPTEVEEPAITTGSATDNSGVVAPSTDTEAVSFFKGFSKKGKGPSKKGKDPAPSKNPFNEKESDVYGPPSHDAGASGLRYTLFILY